MMSENTQLRIKLEGKAGQDIPWDVFLGFSAAMAKVVDEVDASLGEGKKEVKWEITGLEYASAMTAMTPTPITALPQYKVNQRISVFLDGIESIKKDVRPSHFTDNALKGLRKAINKVPEGIQMNIGNARCLSLITPNLIPVINSWLGDRYTAIGSIEGKLDTISARKGFQFGIVTRKGHSVACYFPEKFLPEVLKGILKQVFVRGIITYRSDGIPTSIRITNPSLGFEISPSQDDLPQGIDVTGIWDLGMNGEEYLRRLHGS